MNNFNIYPEYKKDSEKKKEDMPGEYDVFSMKKDVFTAGKEKGRYEIKKSRFIVGNYVRKPD